MTTVKDLFPEKSEFPTRHIGPRKTDVVSMLDLLGFKVRTTISRATSYFDSILTEALLLQSLDELTDKAVPKNIQFKRGLQLEEPLSKSNQVSRPLISDLAYRLGG